MIPYASINNVFNFVNDTLNKNQRGAMTPSGFNAFAAQAQLVVFKEILREYQSALRSRTRYQQYQKGNYGSIQEIKDDLRTLLRYNQPLTVLSGSTYQYPLDYAYYIDVSADGVACDLREPDQKHRNLLSFLTKPNSNFPIAILSNDSIHVYPTTATTVTMSYYKVPQSSNASGALTNAPRWAYTTSGNSEVYNASQTRDFELPASVEDKLAIKILGYAGLSLREQQVIEVSELYRMMSKQNQ